jgi:site-specific recombinase XerC
VQAVLAQLHGVYNLLVQLLYGSALRLSKGSSLRIKDVDLAQAQLVI